MTMYTYLTPSICQMMTEHEGCLSKKCIIYNWRDTGTMLHCQCRNLLAFNAIAFFIIIRHQPEGLTDMIALMLLLPHLYAFSSMIANSGRSSSLQSISKKLREACAVTYPSDEWLMMSKRTCMVDPCFRVFEPDLKSETCYMLWQMKKNMAHLEYPQWANPDRSVRRHSEQMHV